MSAHGRSQETSITHPMLSAGSHIRRDTTDFTVKCVKVYSEQEFLQWDRAINSKRALIKCKLLIKQKGRKARLERPNPSGLKIQNTK